MYNIDSYGWGCGASMVTRRDVVAADPGRFGWDGGYGASWASDPREDMVALLMTHPGDRRLRRLMRRCT
jgi:CubicO group peptidase (beta-lactamase class C family)